MSKIRINDLAREVEVKSREVLDVLTELGLGNGKTHSSSLEEHEAEKVRAYFSHGARPAGHANAASARAPQTVAPKIDLSHISKPGDVLKAVLAKKKEEEQARHSHAPAKPPVAPVVKPAAGPAPKVAVAPPAVAPAARPEPRRIVPQPRSAPPIVAHPAPPPAIASHPPAGPVVAKAPAGAPAPRHAAAASRPAVVATPPPAVVVVKPPVAPAPHEEQPRAAEKPVVTGAHPPAQAVSAPPAAPVAALESAMPAAVVPEPSEPAAMALSESPVVAEKDIPALAAAAVPPAAADMSPAPPPAPQVPAAPIRRMVMPQTGPRPVYKAPTPSPAAPMEATGNLAPGAGIQRGKPIFDRRPSGGVGGYPRRAPAGAPAPGQFPGGP
ncbi:MAG: translation initiation factor IF-2 N-terminal domain-containing protein, partial [Acidobacteriota bacterium]|nr:translation initiation factor IF-2 N-terminal domain-containing protein [Acidobacteriota bacterium]